MHFSLLTLGANYCFGLVIAVDDVDVDVVGVRVEAWLSWLDSGS